MTDQHILAADIGGTTSRFGWFTARKNMLSCVHRMRYATKDADSLCTLLTRVQQTPQPFKVDLAVLAVAGAVLDGTHARPSNIAWDMDLSTVSRFFPRCFLVNDFVAQAYGCRTQIMEKARKIKPGTRRPGGPLAIIGAGTGLGHCALVPDGHGRDVAVPSEAGHAAFALCGQEEIKYQKYLLKKTDKAYVTGEMVVSGPGLSMLHGFLTGDLLPPDQVAALFDPSSPTLDWFARFYGRVCRTYCMTILPTGGLYISGGLAVKNPGIIEHPAFAAEFTNTQGHGYVFDEIPVFLNTEEEAGVWGAAEYGRRQEAPDASVQA